MKYVSVEAGDISPNDNTWYALSTYINGQIELEVPEELRPTVRFSIEWEDDEPYIELGYTRPYTPEEAEENAIRMIQHRQLMDARSRAIRAHLAPEPESIHSSPKKKLI